MGKDVVVKLNTIRGSGKIKPKGKERKDGRHNSK